MVLKSTTLPSAPFFLSPSPNNCRRSYNIPIENRDMKRFGGRLCRNMQGILRTKGYEDTILKSHLYGMSHLIKYHFCSFSFFFKYRSKPPLWQTSSSTMRPLVVLSSTVANCTTTVIPSRKKFAFLFVVKDTTFHSHHQLYLILSSPSHSRFPS